MADRLFEHGGEVAITIPKDLADRYHLAPGIEVEIIPDEDGIVLQPIGVEPWFSIEWERALDAVLEHYAGALGHLSE
jgi:AbrB family looped-hinge helix DNA binding protein